MFTVFNYLFKLIGNYIRLNLFKIKWRSLNRHNLTTVSRLFPLDAVKVGNMSYGVLNVFSWGHSEEGLIIGNYVSISSGVKFLLGGNHRFDTVMTYPIKVKILGESKEATTKGKIIVEDDVWIGMDVKILSGVTIRKGAVVAANSVVVKDVDSYAIVAGNPARLLKYRFDKEVINELNNLNLTNINKDNFKNNIEEFYKPLNKNNYKQILQIINK